MEALIRNIKKSVPIDVFIQIVLKLPAPSVFNLCSSSKEFREICSKYEDRIYNALLKRDGFVKDPNETSKQSYIDQFNMFGQIYVLENVKTFSACNLSNIARIPASKEDLNKPHFTINPIIFNRNATLSDFDSGKEYWIGGTFTNTNSLLKIFETKHRAINHIVKELPSDIQLHSIDWLKQRLPTIFQYLKSFDNNNYIYIRDLLKIEIECFPYIDEEGTQTNYVVKKIRLE